MTKPGGSGKTWRELSLCRDDRVTGWVVKGGSAQISRYLCLVREEFRQDLKNVVKVIIKFSEGEGKALQERAVVGPS
jgi:hypothetical protein